MMKSSTIIIIYNFKIITFILLSCFCFLGHSQILGHMPRVGWEGESLHITCLHLHKLDSFTNFSLLFNYTTIWSPYNQSENSYQIRIMKRTRTSIDFVVKYLRFSNSGVYSCFSSDLCDSNPIYSQKIKILSSYIDDEDLNEGFNSGSGNGPTDNDSGDVSDDNSSGDDIGSGFDFVERPRQHFDYRRRNQEIYSYLFDIEKDSLEIKASDLEFVKSVCLPQINETTSSTTIEPLLSYGDEDLYWPTTITNVNDRSELIPNYLLTTTPTSEEYSTNYEVNISAESGSDEEYSTNYYEIDSTTTETESDEEDSTTNYEITSIKTIESAEDDDNSTEFSTLLEYATSEHTSPDYASSYESTEYNVSEEYDQQSPTTEIVSQELSTTNGENDESEYIQTLEPINEEISPVNIHNRTIAAGSSRNFMHSITFLLICSAMYFVN